MSQRNSRFLTLFSSFILVLGLVFSLSKAALAGPITAGALTKFSIYQGVLSIVPNSTNALEIGNNGTDFAGTSDLYFRPGSIARSAATNAYVYNNGGSAAIQTPKITAVSICFGTFGSTDCKSSWAAAGGGGTLQNVLDAGNTATQRFIGLATSAGNPPNGTPLFLGTALPLNAMGVGVTSGASIGTGNFAFLAPNLGNGAYNPVTQANDSGLFYNSGSGFTIAPWTGGTKGIHLGSSSAWSALAVNNNRAGQGGAGDALAAYSSSNTGSAIYAEQSAGGYAGYFSGPFAVKNFNINPTPTPRQDLVTMINTDSPPTFGTSVLTVASTYTQGTPATTISQMFDGSYENLGSAANFLGNVDIIGAGGYYCSSCNTNRTAALTVLSTGIDNVNHSGVAIAGFASPAKGGGLGGGAWGSPQQITDTPVTGSVGVFGRASNASGAQSSIGVLGTGGTGDNTYAAWFAGNTVIAGGLNINGTYKYTQGQQVCPVGGGNCIGSFLGSGAGNTFTAYQGTHITTVTTYGPTTYTCTTPGATNYTTAATGQTYYTTFDCDMNAPGYVAARANASGYGTGETICVSGSPQSTLTFYSRRSSGTSGNCQNLPAGVTLGGYFAVLGQTSGNVRLYELR